ncbi:MAG: type IV pilus modification protein PilV [Betaproteobacteria bacterium]|nr:type IV pilus modification protein PilV [Betaproteobacteria bacterium]
MTRHRAISARPSGFSMIEVLVSLLIIVLGLLGLAGLQVRMQQSEFESYQRAQALVLLQDMEERIGLHRTTVSCFSFTTDTVNGAPFLGVGSAGLTPCAVSTANDNAMADSMLGEWDSALLGAAETKGGASVGAMVGARGCVSYDAATELLDPTGAAIPGTGVYTVAVSWKGTIDTFAPAVNCGNDNALYGAETRRRVVSTTFRIAKLD